MAKTSAEIIAGIIDDLCAKDGIPVLFMPPPRFWFCRQCCRVMPLANAIQATCAVPEGAQSLCPLPPDIF